MTADVEKVARAQIANRMADLFEEIAQIPSGSITEESSIDNELRIESVQFVELQVAMEEQFNIEIDAIRVVELNKFGSIVDYLFELTQNGTG